MADKGKIVLEAQHDRSSVALMTHQARKSVKDRLGPSDPKFIHVGAQSALIQRQSFNTANQGIPNLRKRRPKHQSHTYTKKDWDQEWDVELQHRRLDECELIRLCNIQ